MTSTQNQAVSDIHLGGLPRILVHQVHELGEWVGFETRNKYEVLDENRRQLAFAAEQQKGALGFLLRQLLGHWRKFDVHFFTPDRRPFMVGHHPFRWFFERIELHDSNKNHLGAIQKRFSIFNKRFDVHNESGKTIMEVSSPIWKVWTFSFMHQGRMVAEVKKKWSGLLSEMFTDKDNFLLEFTYPDLSENERKIILASAVFIDLLYFEHKK